MKIFIVMKDGKPANVTSCEVEANTQFEQMVRIEDYATASILVVTSTLQNSSVLRRAPRKPKCDTNSPTGKRFEVGSRTVATLPAMAVSGSAGVATLPPLQRLERQTVPPRRKPQARRSAYQ